MDWFTSLGRRQARLRRGETVVLVDVRHRDAEALKGALEMKGGAVRVGKPKKRADDPAPDQSLNVRAASADDPMTQIQRLGELCDAGLLTQEEFAAKKAQLLARL
jgi:Short C-terminal domain